MVQDRIAADLKDAMKARDQVRVDTLRSAISAFSYKKIEAGRDLEEADRLDALRKLVKQRNDSIVEFAKAGRTELVEKETRERDLLAGYLPAQKSPEEVRAIVRAEIAALPPEQRTQGGAMKLLMPKLKAEADGNLIRTLVGEELAAASGG